MNKIYKLFSVVLVVVMLTSVFSLGMVAKAAATPSTQTIEAASGETVTLKLSDGENYGIGGKIKYSNRAMFSSVTPKNSDYGPVREGTFVLTNNEKDANGKIKKTEFVVTLTAKISSTAKVGDTCVVTFNYTRIDNGETLDEVDASKTITVKVVEKKQDTSSKPANPSSKPSNPSSKPSGGSTSSKPANKGLDFSALNKQISIAGSLEESNYTPDSWAAMQKALTAAKEARNAKTQAEINAAASNLKKAIANLVRLGNEELEALIKEVKDFLAEDELKQLSDKLVAALDKAEKALKSGDQEAMALALQELKEAFDAYKAKLEELGKGELIGVDKPIEVNPTDDYCNIWLHKLWLILLIVSVVINLGFVGFTVYYFKRRKKNFADNTPLVDYDINDD